MNSFSVYINSFGERTYVVYSPIGKIIVQTTSIKLVKLFCDLGYLDTSKIPDTVWL